MVDSRAPEIDAVAMRLILLRHAKAEKAEPGMRDDERALSARGRADAARIGTYLARHALIPDRVLVSTARRTRETWDAVASALHAAPAVDFNERLYNAGAETVVTVIKQAGHGAAALMLIGHNPGLHDAARLLIASGDVEARERLSEGLPTSGLAVIDFVGQDWDKLHRQGGRLERFVSPRSLAAAGPA
jgi:phosphohistidine phosphatase